MSHSSIVPEVFPEAFGVSFQKCFQRLLELFDAPHASFKIGVFPTPLRYENRAEKYLV